MHVLVTYKNEDPIKTEVARVATTFLPLYIYGNFPDTQGPVNSAVHDRIWLNFELIQGLIVVLATCKNEEDLFKSELARGGTRLYVDVLDTEGQITPWSVVRSGRNSNSSKLLCMSSLPARMKKIQSKMKSLERPHHFSHYKSMGIFPDTQGQVTPQSTIGFGRI